MHELGITRSVRRLDHLLHTPDAFIRVPLPGLSNGEAIIHASPVVGAAFSQMTVELKPGGSLVGSGLPGVQRFVYVLEGSLSLQAEGREEQMTAGSYAYLPAGLEHTLQAAEASRIVVIEKPFTALANAPTPVMKTGREQDSTPTPLMGDSDLQVRSMMPDGPSYDFAVNTMTFAPGASLSLVEMHVMEHGLLMLEGGGIYRLSDCWYPVKAGDFIWMGPYCPQWFGAIGKTPAKYLIYKDFNRHPLA